MAYLDTLKKLFHEMHGEDFMLNATYMELNFFTNYVNAVIDYVIKGEIARESGLSFEQLRAELERLDVNRKKAHDAAISAVSSINKFCDSFGVEHLTDVDITDRNAVANFVGDFILEIYKGEINGGGMDAAVAESNGDAYDTIETVKDQFD